MMCLSGTSSFLSPPSQTGSNSPNFRDVIMRIRIVMSARSVKRCSIVHRNACIVMVGVMMKLISFAMLHFTSLVTKHGRDFRRAVSRYERPPGWFTSQQPQHDTKHRLQHFGRTTSPLRDLHMYRPGSCRPSCLSGKCSVRLRPIVVAHPYRPPCCALFTLTPDP